MSCLSSQESGASTLALSGQDSAPSLSLSERPRANTGSASTGRECLSMMMFAPSQGFLFEELSISSVEDSHASRSASPGSKKGPKTSGTFGPRCHESSAKSDPVGYSLRTYLACELSRLTSCLKTWKDRGTPAGRSWWVLMTSEGRTGENAFGSWPTATANDAKGSTHCYSRGDHSKIALKLPGAVKAWPAGLLAPESPSTLGKPQDWPTPTAHDGRRPGVDIHSTQGGDLSRGVALWRTPSASLIDPKPEGTKLTGRTPQDPQIGIADQVMATEWPTPRANRHGAPDSHGKSPIRGSLNPRWVSQLMGFPTDWLDSPPPIAAKPSRRSATRSAHGTPTSSGGQS